MFYSFKIYLVFQVIPYYFIWGLLKKNESYLANIEIFLLVFCVHLLVVLTVFFFNFLEKKSSEITPPPYLIPFLLFFFICLVVVYKAYLYLCLIIFSQTLKFL